MRGAALQLPTFEGPMRQAAVLSRAKSMTQSDLLLFAGDVLGSAKTFLPDFLRFFLTNRRNFLAEDW